MLEVKFFTKYKRSKKLNHNLSAFVQNLHLLNWTKEELLKFVQYDDEITRFDGSSIIGSLFNECTDCTVYIAQTSIYQQINYFVQ
jgi:hypothetical protein